MVCSLWLLLFEQFINLKVMLKHIVFIKLSANYSESEKYSIINKINLKLNNLTDQINEILKLETGLNISKRPSAFDL